MSQEDNSPKSTRQRTKKNGDTTPSSSIQHWKLQVSADGHRLVDSAGSPFFYLADTAWELFHRCSKEETKLYLKDRQEKGFNVIQAVILAELDGLNTPNSEGFTPLVDNDPAKPNESYFSHIDWVIKQAEALGFYIALLPTWGDKWQLLKYGKGPLIFDNPTKAEAYGQWLGRRYKNSPNIIWVIGGDRNLDKQLYVDINHAMAEGIKATDSGAHLMTFHPGGSKSSSKWLHNAPWLDFNMSQTGHSRKNNPVYNLISHDYELKPTKPCLNGEPQYEGIPVNFNPDNERFVAHDTRQAAYWSVLAGALGHTYGHNSIWQMWKPQFGKSFCSCQESWDCAIHYPGAKEMGYVRNLFESRPFLKLLPAQDMLANVYGQNPEEIRIACDQDGSFAIAYSPYGNPIHLKLKKLSASKLKGYWYNPRECQSKPIHSFANSQEFMAFVPPSSGMHTDWVLVLDDATINYPDPAVLSF